MNAGRVGRADLVRALLCDATLPGKLAEQLGYEYVPQVETPAIAFPELVGPVGDVGGTDLPDNTSEPASSPDTDSRQQFWLAESLTDHVSEPTPEVDDELDDTTESSEGDAQPAFSPKPFELLASMADVVTRLRRQGEFQSPGREPDLPRLIQHFSQGRLLEKIPRRMRRTWGSAIHVICDESRRLIPYQIDQGLVCGQLVRLLNKADATFASWRDRAASPMTWSPAAAAGRWREPAEGGTVLVLGDLGALDAEGSESRRQWQELGQRLALAGVRRVALCPCSPAEVPEELHRLWTIVSWEHVRQPLSRFTPEEQEARVERLLALASIALVLEPQLLRRIRRLLAEWQNDAGIEARVWRMLARGSGNVRGAAIGAAWREELAPVRRRESEHDQKLVADFLEAYRQGQYPGLWEAEVLCLGSDAVRLVGKAKQEAARRWFQRIEAGGTQAAERGRYYCLVQPEVPADAEQSSPLLRRLFARFFRDDAGVNPTTPCDPALFATPDQLIERVGISLRDDRLEFRKLLAPTTSLSSSNWLGTLRYRSPRIRTCTDGDRAASPDFDIDRDFWAAGTPPSWASDWGIDKFGPWATLQVFAAEGAVVQRMRWIPPGTFLMGSHKDEPGRYGDEGPQHEVTISRGYWMFDTSCTQALWQAVMGNNPSYFKSPTRPVETVSWEQCQKFHLRLRELIPGLEIDFPTEAEWEYACRAGAKGPPYNGPFEILGANNAPALDPVAWYGGNCGVDFELANGIDTTNFPDKQFVFLKGGTHPVAQKQANGAGLYDMLGNVWEWCSDGKRAYAQTGVTDPVGSMEASAERVVRGGSWGNGARNVRAAYRHSYPPGNRNDGLGFRCRVQSGEPSQQARAAERRTEGAVSGRSRFAEHGGDSEPATAVRSAAWVQLIDRDFDQTQAPAGPVVRVVTDLEELTLRRIKRPSWASAIGRDEYGLWAEFEVPVKRRQSENSHSGSVFEKLVSIQHKITARLQGNRSKDDEDPWHVVTQRLRWIPPGRFLFGSPKDEPGRVDSREFEPIEKTITNGFWMFDTPCTQELWETIMGKNPSHFQSPSRPVEQVSWNDCQEFLTRSSDRFKETHKGLRLCLPKEVEWEYACRAGTQTATYAGPVEYLGDANAPALDPIAWYGGNCGVEFELTNGYDPSWLKQRQYNFKAGGTHPVGKKEANAWGLYDTLGNVWEWCEDVRIASGEEGKTPADDASAARVVRGGSWYGSARYVRAAYRLSYHPGRQRRHLGFRCRVQTGEPNQ